MNPDKMTAERDAARADLQDARDTDNEVCDDMNAALDAAGIVWGDNDTYASCITRLARARDQALSDRDVLDEEVRWGRKCWIITNREYVVKSETVDGLAAARAATDASGALSRAKGGGA